MSASRTGDEHLLFVTADTALCPTCRSEVLDPADRRYGYTFASCHSCGPRFTAAASSPFARPHTSMAGLPLCSECQREYAGPSDRRSGHPLIGCPTCGPALRLIGRTGRVLAGASDWLERTAQLLRWELIVAVKGPGGFQLVCDAANSGAVASLRERLQRPDQPFTVMVRNMETARRIGRLSPADERLLSSPPAPAARVRLAPRGPVAPEVAPRQHMAGLMLPPSALYLLLLEAGPEALVVTGAGPGGLPLCTDEAEAMKRLSTVADVFLTHDLPVLTPCDDSAALVARGVPMLLRAGRGCVPRPVAVPPAPGAPVILGVGADPQNTFCLLDNEAAVLSQHLGDLALEEGRAGFRSAVAHMERVTGLAPALVACDAHSGSQSAGLAREVSGGTAPIGVQHHHAHLAACMAENGVEEDVIGLVLDAGGYGSDGAQWGFEILTGNYGSFQRVGHLAYSPVPGNGASFRQPLMAATGLVGAHLGATGLEQLRSLLEPADVPVVETARSLMRVGLNCPRSSAAGRLVDAGAAILGICRRQTYPGHAVLELEAAAEPSVPYPVLIRGGELAPGPLLQGLLHDLAVGRPVGLIAGRFLATLVEMAVEGAEYAHQARGLGVVCLSGDLFEWLPGVMVAVEERLETAGFRVYRHRLVPPGDGGVGLGQAMVARRRWQLRV